MAGGTTVLRPGEIGSNVYLVRGGMVAVGVGTVEGRATALALLGPGEVFGELSLLGGVPQPAGVHAVRNTLLLGLPTALLRPYLHDCPAFAVGLAGLLAERLGQAARAAEELLGSAEARVARRLCELAPYGGGPAAGLLRSPPSQQELAAMTGLSRETVNRSMRSFARAGWVRKDGRGYALDLRALRRRAGACSTDRSRGEA